MSRPTTPAPRAAVRLTGCQVAAATGRYAAALAGFAARLAPQYSAVLADLQTERAAARAGFAAGAAHARVPSAAADLLVGWDRFTRFAVEVRALAPGDREAVMRRVRSALGELVTGQEDHLRFADPVDRFVGLVPTVLASGAAHLAAFDDGPPTPPAALGWQEAVTGVGEDAAPAWRPRGNRVGWADAGFVYLLPDAAFSEVQKLTAAQRDPVTMSLRTLEARLHERGLLAEVDTRGGRVRYAVRVSAGGARVAVLKFARAVFYPPADGPAAGAAPAEPLLPLTGTSREERPERDLELF